MKVRVNPSQAAALILLCVAGTSAAAPAQQTPARSGGGSRFEVTVERIAANIYVARRNPSWRYPVQANVTIIINENDVVLVDGGLPRHVENVVAEIRKLTNKPVSAVVMTHWHGDHNWGLEVYRRYYPRAKIISHAVTRKLMSGEVMQYALDIGAKDPDKVRTARLQAAERRKADGAPQGVFNHYRDAALAAHEVIAEYGKGQVVLADETFVENLTLHRGARRIEIRYFGRGNTPGDALVWLPGEKIVVTGDLVVGPTPYGFGSFPAEWADTLREVRALDFEILVPGHGEIRRDTEHLDRLIAMLDDISTQAARAHQNGAKSREEIAETIDLSGWRRRFAGNDPLLNHLFDVWFGDPIRGRAAGQALDDDF